MTAVADLVYLLGAACYAPVLLYQMLVQRKNRHGWRERFGHLSLAPPARPRIWIHAVSLGEINATPRLVAELRRRLPDHEVVISATTDTGYERACKLYGLECAFRYPLDFSWVVSRVFDRVRPVMVVLMELEVWYNLTSLASRRGIPVVVVNGRLTERSYRRFRLLGGIGRSMFSRLCWVGAQDAMIGERFRRAGVPEGRVEITGSVKWDTAQVTDRIDGAEALAAAIGLDPGKPLWVCGSTGPGEEAIILEAYERLRSSGVDVTLAIVPRKPERFDQVAELIRQAGYECLRRSEHPDGSCPPGGLGARPATLDSSRPGVILGDTMGELRKFYWLARVVFVGRSLVPMGGSDPMEVAALGKPMVVGPHVENFAVPVAALVGGGAARLADSAGELADQVGGICRDDREAERLGKAARQVVLDNQGATDQTVEAIVRLLRDAAGKPASGR